MASNATTSRGTAPEVMASVDPTADEDVLVIADVSRDDAFLAIPVAEASTLPEWR
jgi:hypothetical protein